MGRTAKATKKEEKDGGKAPDAPGAGGFLKTRAELAAERASRIQEAPAPTPPPAPTADAGLAGAREEAETARKETADARERILRLRADMDNARKHAERRIQEARGEGIAALALSLLEGLDNLARALEAARGIAGAEAWTGGVAQVHARLRTALEAHGIEPIDALGKPFDPARHEATLQTPAPDPATPPGTVLAVLQDGYRMGERVLRPARVAIAEAAEATLPPVPRAGY